MKRASRKRSRGRLDAVVPVFNETDALPAFQQELAAVLGRLDYAWRSSSSTTGPATPRLSCCALSMAGIGA